MAIITRSEPSGRMIITNSSIPAGNTISNSTTETAFAEPQPVLLPEVWFPGRVFELDVAGQFGTALIVPSLRGRIRIGATVLGDTGSILTVGSLSAKQWFGFLKMTVLTVGTTGTVEVYGSFSMQTGASAILTLPLTNTSTVTLNMTIPQALTLTTEWGAISTNNTITLRQFILKG